MKYAMPFHVRGGNMKLKKIFFSNIYIYFPAVVLSSFILSLLDFNLALGVNPLGIILVSLISILVVHCLNMIRKRIYGILLIILFSLICVCGVVYTFYLCDYSLEKLKAINEVFAQQNFSAIGFCAFSVALIYGLIIYCLQSKVIGKLIFSIAILALVIFYAFKEKSVGILFNASAIAYLILTSSELYITFKYRDKTRQARIDAQKFLLAPIVAFSLLISVLPATQDPFEWKILSRIITKVGDFTSDISFSVIRFFNKSPDKFSLASAGFSKGGTIGGNVKNSYDSNLIIGTQVVPRSALYLIGSVSDTYNDNKWTIEADPDIYSCDEYKLDSYEFLYAMHRSGLLNSKEIMTDKEIKVTHDRINTMTMFYPLKTYTINIAFGADDFQANSANIEFSERPDKDVAYTLRYFELHQSSTDFYNLITKQQNYKYDPDTSPDLSDLYSYFLNDYEHSFSDFPENIETILYNRANQIRRDYCSTDDISDKIKELAKEITKGCTTDYQKLRAIESYLQQYEYTTSPGKTPKGKDVVEYFLFENKKGYCSQYASAMTLLARCSGIPARYVQGYSAVLDRTKIDGIHVVRSNEAHAWTEAYIEGIGWIPFEPTATFTNNRYGEKDYSDVEEEEPEEEISVDTKPKTLAQKVISFKTLKFVGMILSIVIAFIILVSLTLIIIRIKLRKRRYIKADINNKFKIKFAQLIGYCRMLGFSLGESETVNEFASRCGQYIKSDEVSFDDIAKSYMMVRYGEAMLNEKQLTAICLLCNEQEQRLKDKIGGLKLFIYKLK